MAINRPQKKIQTIDVQKNPISVEEFIAGAEKHTQQSEIVPLKPILLDTYTKSKKNEAIKIVESYIPWSVAAGIVPVPVMDLAAIIAVQLSMLAKLGDFYEVPFKKQAAKSAATTLMAGCLQQTLAFSLFSSVKFIPVIGQVASLTILPAVTAAGTYALGRVFISHFEAGGTFINFEPSKMRKQFNNDFQKAKNNH
jgi:uncharacterized protein (DUF697 family)